MGFLDKLLGREEPRPGRGYGQATGNALNPRGGAPISADEQAVARYRYMLQTAPPEQVEQAHAEAFARLSPQQRQLALQQLAHHVPENERGQLSDDPQSLARAATRAEVRQPGFMQNAFGGGMGGGMMGGMGGGMMGGMIAGGLISSLAGAFIGTSIANSFFSNPMHEQGFAQSAQEMGIEPASYQEATGGEVSPDPYGDPANADIGSEFGEFDGGFDSGGFDGGFEM